MQDFHFLFGNRKTNFQTASFSLPVLCHLSLHGTKFFAIGEFLVPTERLAIFFPPSPLFPFFVLWELRAEPVRYFSSEVLCIDSLRGGGRLPPTASFLLGSDC